jgi:hypothetical protein
VTARFRALCLAVLAPLLAASCDGTTTAPSATTANSAETFVGQFGVGGSASRTIVASASGEITITLREAGPPTDVALGLGIGIPSANNVGCHQTRTVQVAAGATPQLAATVDAGTYCVRVFDAGAMTTPIAFSVAISHP